MGTFVSCVLVIVAGLLATSVIVFLLEILSAILLSGRLRIDGLKHHTRPPAAIIVPAHNESSGIQPTLSNIRNQLLPGDRLLVVADNCSDDTAAVAAAAGAEVIERNEPSKRGKGYALDWGVRHLASDPREIVIIIDADCRLDEGAIESLAQTCSLTGRPAQALYLMQAPPVSQINHQVAEFSWRVKNWLRPLGLRAVNLPCQLMGTGMAFPWRVIRSVNIASANIVEDLKLGLDLALAGYPPIFCPSARVTSEFAASVNGAGSQRQRWEQGHLDMIFRVAPRLLANAIRRRNLDLFVMTLDMAVPPLSLLGMLVVGIFGLSVVGAGFGASLAALAISAVTLSVFSIATIMAWFRCGRDVVPVGALLLVPSYAFGKINLYRQFVFGKLDSGWTRTDRRK
jgi:cellulose synthase/poly-beta-1,6-N-acetylglucosamine synthase-like glycosyltransferase